MDYSVLERTAPEVQTLALQLFMDKWKPWYDMQAILLDTNVADVPAGAGAFPAASCNITLSVDERTYLVILQQAVNGAELSKLVSELNFGKLNPGCISYQKDFVFRAFTGLLQRTGLNNEVYEYRGKHAPNDKMNLTLLRKHRDFFTSILDRLLNLETRNFV